MENQYPFFKIAKVSRDQNLRLLQMFSFRITQHLFNCFPNKGVFSQSVICAVPEMVKTLENRVEKIKVSALDECMQLESGVVQ